MAAAMGQWSLEDRGVVSDVTRAHLIDLYERRRDLIEQAFADAQVARDGTGCEEGAALAVQRALEMAAKVAREHAISDDHDLYDYDGSCLVGERVAAKIEAL